MPARAASSLLLLLLSILPAAATTYHVRKDGSDATCDGTADAPSGGGASCAFATVQHGAGAATSPGDRVLIHGGTYFESVLVASNGSAAAPITLAGAPGETAVLDAGIPAFRTPGNSDWEPVDPAIGEYRSVGSYPGKRIYGYILGVPGYENERVTLVPYVDSRDQPGGGTTGFASLRAATDRYLDPAIPFYAGPGLWLEKMCEGGTQPGADCETAADCGVGGICFSTDRIHIRLSKTDDLRSAEGRYGTVLAEENADPRWYPILLTLARTTLRITGSYLRFENFTVNPAEQTVILDSGSHDVTFDGVTIWRGDRGVAVPSGALAPPHHVTITRSRIYGDFPYWIFWSDSKNPPYPSYGLKGTSIDLRSGAHDWEISYCHIRGGMDGIGTNEHEWNVSAHHNRIENFSDDAFEIEGTTDIGRIDAFENFIANCLEAFAPGQASPVVTGPIYFYRNVAALLRDPPVNRAAGINAWNGGYRFGGDHAFKQHSPNTFYYQNTVLLLNGHSKGLNIVPGDIGEQADTYVFNNLLVKVNGFVQGDYLTGPGQIVDHDLYWKVNTTDLAPLVGDFDTLADLTAATGLEISGLGSVPRRGTDPRFAGWGPVFDTIDPNRWKLGPAEEITRPALFVLRSDSPALGAGRPLPVHPRFGLLPDSRASRADLGAIPGNADPSQWNLFPFDQGWPGPIRAMDLVETAVSDPPATASIGSKFSATDTTLNQGVAASVSSTTRYYLSLDMLKNSGDELLSGTRSVPSLIPGTSSTGTVSVTIPSGTTTGFYYLLACADDKEVLAESLETNNCRPSPERIQVTVQDPPGSAVLDPAGSAGRAPGRR